MAIGPGEKKAMPLAQPCGDEQKTSEQGGGSTLCVCGNFYGSSKDARKTESLVTERLDMGLEEKGAWVQSQISWALDVREREGRQ